MIAADIAAALGGERRSGAWLQCLCPVHGSRGATLAFRDGDRGLIVKCFAGCSRTDILAELRRRGLLQDREGHRPTTHLGKSTSARIRRYCAARRTAQARSIWDHAEDARGSPVVPYFAGRCINIAPPPVLRRAPSLRRPDGTYGPAMVTRIDDIDGELIGISRTWLDHSQDGRWGRRDHAMLGRAAGGAVRLAPAAAVVMVGEGLESCLAGVQATGCQHGPHSRRDGMKALVLPPIVRRVVILADNDANGTGERATHAAARRWLAEGRQAQNVMSPESGADLNDILIGGTEPRHDAA
jgi:putative DNA primase/helicase